MAAVTPEPHCDTASAGLLPAKAGVKAFTEALQHELRSTPGCRISAHLLILK